MFLVSSAGGNKSGFLSSKALIHPETGEVEVDHTKRRTIRGYPITAYKRLIDKDKVSNKLFKSPHSKHATGGSH